MNVQKIRLKLVRYFNMVLFSSKQERLLFMVLRKH